MAYSHSMRLGQVQGLGLMVPNMLYRNVHTGLCQEPDKLSPIVPVQLPVLVLVLFPCSVNKLSLVYQFPLCNVFFYENMYINLLLASTFWASREGLKLLLMTTLTSIFWRPTSLTNGITRKGRLISFVIRYLVLNGKHNYHTWRWLVHHGMNRGRTAVDRQSPSMIDF